MDCASEPNGIAAGRPAAALALATLAGLALAVPGEAQAQTVTTFISNAGQESLSSSGDTRSEDPRATAFTTGENDAGYWLTSVDVFASAFSGSVTPRVEIFLNSTDNRPRTRHATLISPGLAGRFIDELPGDSSTKNQALAALRHFFDTLVTRHASPLNPFQSVRGRKHDTTDGKTPGLSIPQARDLLRSIDTSHVVGLRDRPPLGTLAYTGARIGAIARLRRGDIEDQGAQRVLRFREKRGKQREIPVRHDLDRWLEEYLAAAGIETDPKEAPLFRSALGKQKQLSPRPLPADSMGLMFKRRLKDAGLPPIFSPHSFRVLVVTDLLSQDVPLEDVQYLAGHANPRTTQIYDRRRRVTRNIVERISV